MSSLQTGDRLDRLQNGRFVVIGVTSGVASVVPFVSPPPPPMNAEEIYHVYGDNCQQIQAVPAVITRWDEQLLTVDGSGWQLVYVLSDKPNDITTIGRLTSLNETHQFFVDSYKGTVLQGHKESSVVSIKVKGDGNFGQSEFNDFYSDGGGLQWFWYGPHTSSILHFEDMAFPQEMKITDECVFFAPLTPGAPLNFKPANIHYFTIGQETNVPGIIPLKWSLNDSPCATPMSLAICKVNNTNMCEVLRAPDNYGDTMNLHLQAVAGTAPILPP